jgi:hypothetical protein
MDKKNLSDFIKHIIFLSSELGIVLTKTPLIKLLYLIDVEYYRATGEKLTNIDWIFYKYGPYAFELEGILTGMGLSEEIESKGKELLSDHLMALIFRSKIPSLAELLKI